MKPLDFARVMLVGMIVTVVLSTSTIFLAYDSSASEPAKPQVTLLVSLDPAFYPHGLAALFHDYSEYPDKVEAAFRQAFQNTGYDVQVIQGANIFDLYETLVNEPNTVGVFWVSHEAPISWSKDPGVEINPLLVDQNRADVKSVFREISPSIRWVSLVACDSDQVISWLGSPSDPSTQLQGFNTEIDAIQGLKQAVRQSIPVLNNSSAIAASAATQTCETKQGLPLFVKRQASAVGSKGPMIFPAVMIEHDGEILGALQEIDLRPGQIQNDEQEVFLTPPSSGQWSAQDLQLVIDSGLDPAALPQGFGLGSFSVSAIWDQASWKTFAKADGTPFGVTEQVILSSGSLPSPTDVVSYQPFACN